MPEVATPNQAEREFETGTDESFKNSNATEANNHNENQRIVFSNIKRTFDAYQDLDLQTARQINNISTQALQNAVETANMVGKQYLRHSDLAADSFWNPVSSAAGMNLTAGSVPSNRTIDQETAVAGGTVANASAAVASAVAKQVDATITPVLAVLQQLVQTMATMNASLGNVIAQVQPKTT